MARYDRIARLDLPRREEAFSGWLTLRDLDGREREPELGRRARLRYLALRPVKRLLRRGLDGLDDGSLQRQLDAVREELGQLPIRDPERQLLSDYLRQVGGRTPQGVAQATLDVGGAAEASGHTFAAEEFYRTGLELAEAHGLPRLRAHALRSIGRLYRRRGHRDQAIELIRQAADIADREDDLVEWARAMDGIAAVHLQAGDGEQARDTLTRIADRGEETRDRRVAAIAAAGRCALELAAGDEESALTAGWHAVELLAPTDEIRNGVLLNMGAAFRRLGLDEAAASCYHIVEQWAPWPEHRIEAQVENALVAAETGDVETFAARREELLGPLESVDRSLRALAELGLGRGSLVVDRVEDARTHLRTAIAAARDTDSGEVLARAEDLLTALEERAAVEMEVASPPSERSRRIAERVAGLDLAPVG